MADRPNSGVKWRQFIVDFFILAIVGFCVLFLEKGTVPYRRGFFCDDESIRYEEIDNPTFSSKVLAAICIFISLTTIIAVEILQNKKNRASSHFLWRPMPVWVTAVYHSLVYFLFGCVASQLMTDLGKYTIGRLRPNFIDVCRPNVGYEGCSSELTNKYITEYHCMASDEDAKESRVSFPSGHSSFSAYTMLYVAIFVQVKVVLSDRSSFRLAKHAFQLGVLMLAFFTGLSRVMDNKHHWSDVLTGFLIGTTTAALITRYVAGLLDGTQGFKRLTSFHDITLSTAGPEADLEANRSNRTHSENINLAAVQLMPKAKNVSPGIYPLQTLT